MTTNSNDDPEIRIGEKPVREIDKNGSSALLLGQDSDTKPALSIILPTLNEQEGVANCIDQIITAVQELSLPAEIIVSDSSTDKTPLIARAMGAIVVKPDREGYGGAYQRGFEVARGEYIAIGDADTTYDFTALPQLLEPVKNGDADICLGSRFEGTIKPGAMPKLHKYVGNPLLTRFLNMFYSAGVSDAHSGFRVLSREATEQLTMESDGMEFASEMVMEASARGLTITEVPITYHKRKGEETLDSFRDGWRHVKFMLLNAPGYLFSIPGLLVSIAGSAIMMLSFLSALASEFTFDARVMITGAMLTIGGYHVMCLGLFSSASANPIQEPQDPLTNWITRNFQLEHGVLIGALLLTGGVGGSLAVFLTGSQAIVPPLPWPVWTLLAVTAVLVGTITVFSSFFLGLMRSDSNS